MIYYPILSYNCILYSCFIVWSYSSRLGISRRTHKDKNINKFGTGMSYIYHISLLAYCLTLTCLTHSLYTLQAWLRRKEFMLFLCGIGFLDIGPNPAITCFHRIWSHPDINRLLSEEYLGGTKR